MSAPIDWGTIAPGTEVKSRFGWHGTTWLFIRGAGPTGTQPGSSTPEGRQQFVAACADPGLDVGLTERDVTPSTDQAPQLIFFHRAAFNYAAFLAVRDRFATAKIVQVEGPRLSAPDLNVIEPAAALIGMDSDGYPCVFLVSFGSWRLEAKPVEDSDCDGTCGGELD